MGTKTEKKENCEKNRLFEFGNESETPLLKSSSCSFVIRKRHRRRGKLSRRKTRTLSSSITSSSDLNALLENSTGPVVLPQAPCNTNQFLIEDHGESDVLDKKLSKLPQTADSSLSYDSECDIDFLSDREHDDQDFFEEYQKMHFDQLSDLSKSDLLERHVQLEDKYQSCVKMLQLLNCVYRNEEKFKKHRDSRSSKTSLRARVDDAEEVSSSGDEKARLAGNNSERGETLEFYKNQVKRLRIENGQIKRKHRRLLALIQSRFRICKRRDVKCS